MKKFTVINEGFKCLNCKHDNEKLAGSCRNHCQKCLFSLHLDQENPGDRLSKCQNLMTPISITHNGKKGWMIKHKCLKCEKTILNKAALDDNFELIIKLTQVPL